MKTLEGKIVNDAEIQTIKRKNQELLKEAESGNMAALLDVVFLFNDDVYEKVFTDAE